MTLIMVPLSFISRHKTMQLRNSPMKPTDKFQIHALAIGCSNLSGLHEIDEWLEPQTITTTNINQHCIQVKTNKLSSPKSKS